MLKVYAVLNAIAGFIIFLMLPNPYIEVIFLSVCFIVSFGIYAFGEAIQLLQDIKDGTRGTLDTIQNQNTINSDDLPSI